MSYNSDIMTAGRCTMAGMGEQIARQQRTMGPLLVAAVVVGLIGLPVAAWLDLRELSERMLRTQASEISRIIDEMRGFYGSEVVGRVLQADDAMTATHKYRDVPGAIPTPATLSIELGKRISAHDGSIKYRFVSDLPSKAASPTTRYIRAECNLCFRANPSEPIIEASGSLFDRHVRAAAPVVMGQVCVNCHNSPPDSPKTDWKVGTSEVSRRYRSFSQSRQTSSLSNICYVFRLRGGGGSDVHCPAASAVRLHSAA